ncbi:hypothetical protein Glove_526g18 [Diversispora epigaea]|uniref:CCHC-type domain-containing protein n=1 Tax=Diversispora epigaea TaxID=1348612 RepID=A0A397GGL1_9GLOM|nr:hypothetical protein Glove_526g18 [Diversispora epigaea]
MDPAYVEVLETNKVLRDELNSEVNINILNEKKICKYLYELEIALEDIKKKESYIPYLEQELINLEDEVNRLKFRIHEIYSYRNITEDIIDMAQRPLQPLTAEIIQNYEDIQRHLGDVRLYFQNRIQIPFSRDTILKKLGLISTASNRLQEIAQNNQLIDQRIIQFQNQYDTSQGILNLTRTAFTNEQQNNPLSNPNMAAIQEVIKIISTRFSTIPDYDGQEPPDIYYNKLRNINESCCPLGCIAFDAAQRANNRFCINLKKSKYLKNPKSILGTCIVIIGKMAGRFFPVPAQNPYNANANINTKAEMLNWMQGRYREIMVGSTRAALKTLMNEKFSMLDTPDTYEKRIKPFVQGIPFADLLPYLYDHIPDNLEMRIRITAPANLEAFFTELRNKLLESGGLSGISPSVSTLPIQQIPQFSQKNDALEKFVNIAVRLRYSGDLSDPIVIHKFVETKLNKKYGSQTNHIKKKPFEQNNNTKRTYATKKKLTKIIYRCSNCKKLGHRKNNCPSLKDKRSKKVNYTYQSEPENSDQENESIVVLEDSDEKGSEAEESTSDNELQSCFNRQSSTGKTVNTLEQEVFLESLKYMISELIPNCPKEILIELHPIVIHKFVETKLNKKYGSQTNHIKKKPFEQNNNTKRTYATKKKLTKIIYRCSNCKKLGHRKNNCPSLKDKRSKKVNYTYQSEPENSDQENESIVVLEDSDEKGSEAEESTSDNELQSCFNRQSSTGKTVNTLEQEVFLESLKYMISELIPNCPKEILIELRTFLNNLIIKMKNRFDLYYEEKYTVKERNRVWENITKKYLTIFQPFIELLNRQSPNSSSYKETNPHAILDTGADSSIFTDNIPKHLGIKIDKKNVYKLTGAVGDSQSIGTLYNVPITIDNGEDSITVHEDISVIPTKKIEMEMIYL